MPSLPSNRSFIRLGVGSPLAALAVTAMLAVSTPARADDSSWPRQIDSSSGSLVIYQPQPEDLTGDVLNGRAAFSLQKSGDANPTFGVLWFTEHVEIDRDSFTVAARSFDVTKVRLPRVTAAEASRYEKVVETEAAQWDFSGSLAELQAGLAATEKERASVANLKNNPPRIVFASERTILVVYDGSPTLEPIEGSDLERVANTPYAVVFDPSSDSYYLNGANLWYRAKDPLGPWTDVRSAPPAVRAIVPPDSSATDQVQGPPPVVMTATEPTELIATDGPPQYAPLVGDELLYITNTESDVVREVSSQEIYVLLAGRWYKAASTAGPWTFVRGDQLPASFKQIPLDSPKGNILASVAGTEQAEDAIADAEIPQTSPIRRSDSNFEADYDGSPQFQEIEGTSLQYAINTDAQIILADGRYYACDQGVWYVAYSPDGPWSVSDTRPLGVDDIPLSCPVYNVRYVYIFDVTPDVIYMGYLPGYIGCYPYYGTVVYGTGYDYAPWRGHHHYCPRPVTWGYHARYNPWMSRWSFGFSYWTGFLRVGTRWDTWHHHPRHHGPPMWFGPGGYRRPLLAEDRTPLRPRRAGVAVPGLPDRTPVNLYNRPGNVLRVDRNALRAPVYRGARPAARPAQLPNNKYAGRDGKVYQRDESGNWQVNEGRKWKPARLPVTTPSTPRAGASATAPGRSPGAAEPTKRPSQPAPAPRSAAGQVEPHVLQPAHPAPPKVDRTPGNLEREYRARERASPGVRTATPAPRPEPARQEKPKEKGKPEAKPEPKPER